MNRLEEAESHYRDALEAFAAASDLSGEADTCLGMAEIAEHQHRIADALEYSRRALDTFRLAGDAIGEAIALCGVGWSHALLGEYHQALTVCQDALVLMPELGLREGEAATWNSLGYAHHRASAQPPSRPRSASSVLSACTAHSVTATSRPAPSPVSVMCI